MEDTLVNYIITNESINQFKNWLKTEDRSNGTIEKYIRDIHSMCSWLEGRALTKESLTEWKEHLKSAGYSPNTVNSMLAAANTFCRFAGLGFKVKFLKIQRKMFCDDKKELSKQDYEKLIESAIKKGKERLAMIIETIGATGIRVSELKYITVEAAKLGRTEISLKGKIRTILLPKKLCKKLLKYAKKNKIASGEIFITRSGKGIARKQVWAEMKVLCNESGVAASKVFPHNLRHLFARTFYRTTKDVSKLADILGHSSIETTRIYLLSTGEEHNKLLERMCLVC